MKGAVQILEKREFDENTNFVDLHLDFPVSFDKYVMGNTPFMKAAQRVGHKAYMFHDHRLNALNQLYPLADDLRRITRLYSKNTDLFARLCKSRFDEHVQSQEPHDINAALYRVIAKVFFPFSLPEENANAVNKYMQVIRQIADNDKSSMDAFVTEIIDSGFLRNIQKDCLEIYPRVLEAELPLRPALFLDLDEDYHEELVAFRVSIGDFTTLRDLFKDISEVLSRAFVLVAGLNNLIHRGDHNKFKDAGKHTPASLNGYADVPFGSKVDFLDETWYAIDDGVIDNQLRNSVAHYKTEYDEISQVITYFPRREGMKQEKQERMYFLDFMRKILLSYREMHAMHQLIKCIYNYYFFLYEK